MHKTSACKRSALYKTEMCRSFEETGYCRYAVKCQFAHSQAELRQVNRHPRYKTEVCKTFWELGQCPYGKRCCFIHGATKQEEQQQQQQESDLFTNNWQEDDRMLLHNAMLLTPRDSGSFLRESFGGLGCCSAVAPVGAIGALGAPGSGRRKSFTGTMDSGTYLKSCNLGARNSLLLSSEEDFVSILERKLDLLDNRGMDYLMPNSCSTPDEEMHFYSPLLALPVFCPSDFTIGCQKGNSMELSFQVKEQEDTLNSIAPNSKEEQSLLPSCLVESFCV